jgi:rhodanese-related sulfurtransferase
MERFFEFAGNHPLLIAGIVAVIVAIIANEVYQLVVGSRSVDTATATNLYNREDAVFVDLRSENAFLTSHLPGAVNVPMARIEQQQGRLQRYRGRPLIVYGEPGRGAGKAIKTLRAAGFEPVYELRGGFLGWQDANLPLESRG